MDNYLCRQQSCINMRLLSPSYDADQATSLLDDPFVNKIKLIEVIGRQAHDVRNNIYYDSKGRVLYSTGATVVSYRYMGETTKGGDGCSWKEFIHQKNGTEVCERVTAMAMSSNRKFVFTCQSGTMASMTMWEIATKIRVNTIILKNLVKIIYMKMSDSNQRALVYGLNETK